MTRRSAWRRPAWVRKSWLYAATLALIVGLVVVLAVAGNRDQETTVPGGGTAVSPTDTAGAPTDTAPGSTNAVEGSPDGETLGVAVSLLEVVDGDTIWVRMPDGSHEKVRYIGIDAPEIAHVDSPGEYLGDEATSHNAGLLASGPLRLATDVEERDEFGRLLAYVWAGEVFVNERMVLDGYAWAHNYPPNLTRQERLWAAHDQARAAGVGIWAEDGR